MFHFIRQITVFVWQKMIYTKYLYLFQLYSCTNRIFYVCATKVQNENIVIKLATASFSKTTTSTLGASSPTPCSWIWYTPAACRYVALKAAWRNAFVMRTSSLRVSTKQSSTLRAHGKARPIRTWPQSPPKHRKCTMLSFASTKWTLMEPHTTKELNER